MGIEPLEWAWSRLRSEWHVVSIALVLVAAVAFRLRGYGDLTLTVATDDTAALVEAARFPLTSPDFYTETRSISTSLLYRLLEPDGGYRLTAVSRPADTGPMDKADQPGGERIAVAQTILSILCWSLLAISAARRVRNPLLKIAMTAVVLAFAFTPQLAEWDSILMTESLSFSLYAGVLAGILELSARVSSEETRIRPGTWILLFVVVLVLILWVFTRDSNAYAIPITLILIVMVLGWPAVRRRVPSRALLAVSAMLLVLFVVQSRLLFASDRWVNPFLNNLIYRILPDGNRLSFFVARGMPHTGDVMAYVGTRGNEVGMRQIQPLMDWVYARGPKTYVTFLAAHPQWAFLTLVDNMDLLFSENRQPFFRGPLAGFRVDWTADLGSALHLLSSGTVLISGILTIALAAAIWRRRLRTKYGVAWAAVWQVLTSLAILFVSFYGDSLGIVRHALGAVVPLRLSIWMLGILLADAALTIDDQALGAHPPADVTIPT